MAKYKVTTITDEGKITSNTQHAPIDYECELIALALAQLHRTTPFSQLLDMAQSLSTATGYQRAFVDENCTIVVTLIVKGA